MSRSDVLVVKINPYAKRMIPLQLNGADFKSILKRQCQCKVLGWKELTIATTPGGNDIPLIAAANGMQDRDDVPGFRLIGGETTAGYSILFGKGPGGGMTHIPVDMDWLERHLRWATAEECNVDAAEQELRKIAGKLHS